MSRLHRVAGNQLEDRWREELLSGELKHTKEDGISRNSMRPLECSQVKNLICEEDRSRRTVVLFSIVIILFGSCLADRVSHHANQHLKANRSPFSIVSEGRKCGPAAFPFCQSSGTTLASFESRLSLLSPLLIYDG